MSFESLNNSFLRYKVCFKQNFGEPLNTIIARIVVYSKNAFFKNIGCKNFENFG